MQAEVNHGLAEQLAFARESLAVAEQLAQTRGAECSELKRRLVAAEAAREAAEQRVAECEVVRRRLHNTILVSVPQQPCPLHCLVAAVHFNTTAEIPNSVMRVSI